MPDTTGSDAADPKLTLRVEPDRGRETPGGIPPGRRSHAILISVATGLFLLILVGGFIRAGLGASPNAPEVVKLGLIAPFEGPSRPLGYAVLNAVRLRLQRWNESGGVPRVELVALNDDGDPALAAKLPAQLALDPDVLLVLGPPQGHTAVAALPGFQSHSLPAISLAPLPDSSAAGSSDAQVNSGTVVAPFGGSASTVRLALAERAPGAVVAWHLPITTTSIWLGDPQTLALLRDSRPELVPAAGAVASEEAFAAWAGSAGDGLVWATAYPVSLPADVLSVLETSDGLKETGALVDPTSALAYAAADEALKLLHLHRTRSGILAALDSIDLPPMRLFERQSEGPGKSGSCCQPLSSPP